MSAWQYGKPKCIPFFGAWFNSSGGRSSPIQSRPLSVNHSSFVSGCQSKPTVFRTPEAKISRSFPSGFIRMIEAYRPSFFSHTLHGAPTGT